MHVPLFPALNGRTRRLAGRPLSTEPISGLVKQRLMRASLSRCQRRLDLLNCTRATAG
jgi:hypothetical protein